VIGPASSKNGNYLERLLFPSLASKITCVTTLYRWHHDPESDIARSDCHETVPPHALIRGFGLANRSPRAAAPEGSDGGVRTFDEQISPW
jgi:hypothetical protein